jgi:hypothetical protein
MCLIEYYAMKTYHVVEVYSYFHTFLIWQHEFVSKTIGVEFVGDKVVRRPVSLQILRYCRVGYTTSALHWFLL